MTNRRSKNISRKKAQKAQKKSENRKAESENKGNHQNNKSKTQKPIQKMKTELEERTKNFAVAVVRDVLNFPRNVAAEVIGRQVLRSAASIGANYREANRAQSREDFIHKVSLAEKEAAETQYWLEICQAVKLGRPDAIQARLTEAGELLAILLTIGKNTRRKTK